MTHRETEIKLHLSNVESTRAKLAEIHAKEITARHFEDNFLFDTSDSQLRKSGKLLRLRLAEGRGILTMKSKGKISDGVKDREEIECKIEPPQKMEQILRELGYSVTFRYQKYRTIYKIERISVELFLDETPIGNYLEIEGEIESIHQIAERLGFERNAYITESYISLYAKWCRQHGSHPSEMIFP
jgi:adenylate cyclase, class 2